MYNYVYIIIYYVYFHPKNIFVPFEAFEEMLIRHAWRTVTVQRIKVKGKENEQQTVFHH